MEPARILALTPNLYGRSPGQRSSIELWEKVLNPEGIELEHVPFETERLRRVIYARGSYGRKAVEVLRAYIERVATMRSVDEYDAVLVYREAALIGPALLERWVHRSGKPIIYQLDDPLYLPYRSPFSGYLSYLKFFGKVRTICRLSRTVIVNSSHHFDFASRLNDNVWQIPSLVDGESYRYVPQPANGSTVALGWTGSASTVPNLSLIGGALREVAAREDVRLELVGTDTSPVDSVPCVARPWSAETEVEDLRRIQVGLLPVPDTKWNRRKFFLKLVQYMALGIPAVCSPMGSNPEVVRHGETGFLAADHQEWVQMLTRLATDAELRTEMGARAAEDAAERFTVEANAERILAAVRSALN